MRATESPMNILEIFDDADFPMTKTELVSHAMDHDASEEALDMLHALPSAYYESFEELNNDLGEIEDLPGHENLWASDPDTGPRKRGSDIASEL